MKLSALQHPWLGQWAGEKRLWMGPDTPPFASPSQLTVALEANGKFLSLRYDWAWEGKPQQGLLLVGDGNPQSIATAAWVDSFHMSGKIMQCTGAVEGSALRLLGHYEAPPGPDWGWQIAISRSANDELVVEMHNVPPGADASLAVQIVFGRV